MSDRIFFIIHIIDTHPDLNRLVTGVWITYEAALLAFEEFKQLNPKIKYSIASYPIYKYGEGLP